MITREQIQDLREGDVVELGFSSGAIVRGPLVEDRHAGGLDIAEVGWTVRQGDGELGYCLERYAETLTVVSRAPRPLYVNHPRTEPVPGDVVRDADGTEASRQISVCGEYPPGDRFAYPEARSWLRWNAGSGRWTYFPQSDLPTRLRLLVDGETGQVVP